MKRVLLISLFSLVFALALTGCGGSTSNPPLQTTGTSATIAFGDAPLDAVVKFEMNVSVITLTGVSPTTTTGNLLAKPVEFEFSHAAGTLEPVSLANIPAGSYSGATMTITGAEMTVVNGTTPTKIPVTLSSNTATITFAANITVGTTPLFVNFDLDLANSVVLNGTPITSATVTPKFTVTSTSTPAAGNEGNEGDDNGGIEDVHGTVSAITAPNFTITTTSGASIVFVTDANTKFKDGITQLSDLKVNDIVEVDGVTKADGSKLATKVEREGGQNGEELEGLISALDSPLTKITIAHQFDSTGSSSTAPVTVDVTVNASTVYSVRADKLSATGTFDATHIGKGQRIEADAASSTAPITATKVKLREQAVFGTVAATPAPTATSFTINVSATSAFGKLSGATTVAVTVANGGNLSVAPTAGATIRARGLVFFNAGAYTMTATKGDNKD